MNWLDYSTKIPISQADQFNENVIGFVYLIEYTDGTKYIGKKNIYCTKTLPILKNGKYRPNCERILKNTGKGYRQPFDIVKKETNWKKYKGSHEDCKNKNIKNKYILAYAHTKLQLTYYEVKYQFIFGVLEDTKFINDNILGKFYRENLSE